MSRSADYTIQGFLYQFLLTIQTLLNTDEDDAIITVEGIDEDIELSTSLEKKAIQCKYHEAKTNFQLSDIYKPVLQMLAHYNEYRNSNILYILHCYFPNEEIGTEKKLCVSEIRTILNTKNSTYMSYTYQLEDISDEDISAFLCLFTLHFGHDYYKTQEIVKNSLIDEGFEKGDIDELIFPNAVQYIAEKSIIHDESKRTVVKKEFIFELTKRKKIAVSQWTKALYSNNKILQNRRKQLLSCLEPNYRERCLILDIGFIDNGESEIVTLISDFLNHYSMKALLQPPPLICIVANIDIFNNIWTRLHKKRKGIKIHTGIIGSNVDFEELLRDPDINPKEKKREFDVRLYRVDNQIDIPLSKVYDDVIICSRNKNWENSHFFSDCNIEIIETPVVNEIKYLLNLTKVL